MPAAHVPTKKLRKKVRKMTRVGVPIADICTVLKITDKTLTKHYKDDIERGLIVANAMVANILYRMCVDQNLGAVIFWLKTKAKWRESDSKDIKEEAMALMAAVRAGATLTNEVWSEKMVRKDG